MPDTPINPRQLEVTARYLDEAVKRDADLDAQRRLADLLHEVWRDHGLDTVASALASVTLRVPHGDKHRWSREWYFVDRKFERWSERLHKFCREEDARGPREP